MRRTVSAVDPRVVVLLLDVAQVDNGEIAVSGDRRLGDVVAIAHPSPRTIAQLRREGARTRGRNAPHHKKRFY